MMTDSEDPDDLYALLNIPKSDIKSAYKRLCVAFHPDKLPYCDPEQRASTSAPFTRIQTAYSSTHTCTCICSLVLSDDRQRAIYDRLGMRGVRASWQLSQTNQSHRLRDILEALESSTSWTCRTAYDCGLDASIWFDQSVSLAEVEDVLDVLPRVRNMSIQQTFEKNLDPSTSLAVSLAMLKQYQQGGASISVSGTRILAKDTQLHFAMGVYGRRFAQLVLKQTTRIGELSLGTEVEGGESRHSFAWSKAIGEDSAIGIGLTQGGEEQPDVLLQMHKGTLEAAIGVRERTLSVRKAIVVTEDVNALLKLSIKGAQSRVSLGVQRTWSQDSVGTVSLQADVQEGIALRVGLKRRDLEVSLPILLSPDLNPSAALYGSVLPALAISLINSFVVKPFKRWQSMRDTVESEKQSKEALEARRMEAEIATEILQKSNHARTLHSLLKITKAVMRARDCSLEVTVQLQYQVHDNQLRIARRVHWCGLVGVYDFAPGEDKQLSIEYVFKDKQHRAVFGEDSEVALPQRIHLINP